MPLISKNIFDNQGYQVALWQIDESIDELYLMIVDKLSSDDLEKFQQLKNDIRRKEFLCIRILLFEIFGHCPTINYDNKGKPTLSEKYPHISISHTEKMVAIMFSDDDCIGIDIEKISSRIERIKEKFLTSSELQRLNDNYKLEYLFVQWCAKEALYKAVNTSNYDYQNTYTIPEFCYSGQLSGNTLGKILTQESEIFLNVTYAIRDNYVICVATKL